MRATRFILEGAIALIMGFALGLTYAWVIAPVKYVDADPQALRADFKDHFRSVISAAYASNGDLERARARLDLLNDPDPAQALNAQAQRMMASGESPEAVQQVVYLASALQGLAVTSVTPTWTPTSTVLEEQSIGSPTGTPEETLPTSESEATGTPLPELTTTPRPTLTPTPTLGAPYQLVGQDTICESDLAEGLLQIFVINAARKQIPGAEIVVTWNEGEEHIFTGLKPEINHGYADYLMSSGVTYSLRMADGGTPATGLSAPPCTDKDGNPYTGGLRITFQKP